MLYISSTKAEANASIVDQDPQTLQQISLDGEETQLFEEQQVNMFAVTWSRFLDAPAVKHPII